MSRIGRKPIAIPAGVTVTVDGNNVTVTGPKGTLNSTVSPLMTVAVEGATVVVSRPDDEAKSRSLHGLTRTLIANMVEGVTKGFSKSLTINGVGYKCSVSGNKLVLNIGYSHPINFDIPEGIKITCPSATEIKVEGASKEKVGQVAADIKAFRPVEPYHAYGVRYTDQHVIRKEIKKAAKKK